MFAETEINLVNGLAALCLGIGLLVLVAWVDRRYLQKYEDVQSAVEERKNKAEKPLIDEAVTEETTIPSAQMAVVASSPTTDSIAWKSSEPKSSEPKSTEPKGTTPTAPAEPLETVLPARRADEPSNERPADPPKVEQVDVEKPAEIPKVEHVAVEKPAEVATKAAPEPVSVSVAADASTIDLRAEADEKLPVEPEPVEKVLPRGAEAALASILEVVPDPRNTFAFTRDPTAEVRLTKVDRENAVQSRDEPRAS